MVHYKTLYLTTMYYTKKY